MIIHAPAKINLHLHITGRRDDGFHKLDSLVAFTNFSDEISIRENPSYRLNILNSSECPIDDNLITRAVKLLTQHFDIKPNINIDLKKSIPMGAGLGGGSSDAAAVLIALRDFWKLDAPDDLLKKFASELGSDVVACLHNKPLIMRDTGNALLPAPKFPTLYGVLVVPKTPCSTPLVYKKYMELNSGFSQNVEFPNSFDTVFSLCAFLNKHTRNDLTKAAIAINPDVGIILNKLKNLEDNLLTRLTGSGSGCYTLTATEDLAIKSSNALQKFFPDWFVKHIRIND